MLLLEDLGEYFGYGFEGRGIGEQGGTGGLEGGGEGAVEVCYNGPGLVKGSVTFHYFTEGNGIF